MEERFGRFVDGCLARRVLSIDAESRVRLLEQVAIALNKAAMRLAGNAVGNYGPDEDAARVPAWKGAPPRCHLGRPLGAPRWRPASQVGGQRQRPAT